MRTAAYTICKNEIKRIEQWFQYADRFDYLVVLDTGSTDGTWDYLLEKHHLQPDKIIIEQKTFEPFRFDEARNYNLGMVPDDVDWALSPDMDEWFSINVLDEMEKIIESNPDCTNITTTRLDIYSDIVFVGPPYHLPSNKIHKRHHYVWKQPIYEHLWPKDLNNQKEVHSDKIFLVHDQDTSKPRSNYKPLMETRFKEDPMDCWNNWYLLNLYYRERDLIKYVEVASMYIKYSITSDNNFKEVYDDLANVYRSGSILVLDGHSDTLKYTLNNKLREILDESRSKL